MVEEKIRMITVYKMSQCRNARVKQAGYGTCDSNRMSQKGRRGVGKETKRGEREFVDVLEKGKKKTG